MTTGQARAPRKRRTRAQTEHDWVLDPALSDSYWDVYACADPGCPHTKSEQKHRR